jgi:hypothetical protein
MQKIQRKDGRDGEAEQPRLRRATDRDGLVMRCHPWPTSGLVTKKKREGRAGLGLGMLRGNREV